MEHMYQHLVKGCMVPQALRLAMLRLARRPSLDQPVSEHDVADGLQEAWRRPMHWAGFLVMGASTRLPCGDAKAANAEALSPAAPPKSRYICDKDHDGNQQ